MSSYHKSAPISDLPLFADTPERYAEQAASEHEEEIRKLIPIAQRLAAELGPEGVTVADVRAEAVKLGLIPPLGEGRSLSYLGALCRRAGLVATNRTRRSHVEGSHQNRHVCWTLPAYANQETAA